MIGDRPLTEIVPLQQKGADQEVVTQFSMGDVEELGLLKMDFLGLRNLDVIDKAVELIGGARHRARSRSTTPRPTRCSPAATRSASSSSSPSGMREALRQVKPTEFEDLIALVALYRPGPMRYIPAYAARKHGPEPVDLPRPAPAADHRRDLRDLHLPGAVRWRSPSSSAGFSPAEADDLRKAIGKKIHELMATLKDKFLEGCAANGVHAGGRASSSGRTWRQPQDYSFNKSHAACYALIAYRTAWLKANYPAEYMAALISSVMNTKDKVPVLRQRLRRDGDRGAAARRQLLGARLRGRRGQDPLRPERGQERRRGGGAGDRRARARRAARSPRSGTSASASTRAS